MKPYCEISTSSETMYTPASRLKRAVLKLALAFCLTAAVLGAAASAPALKAHAASGNMQITPIDFGPGTWGDATIVSSGGRNLLMDTCNVDNYNTIINYLSTHDFYSFDIYISHYHYDHMYQVVPILQDARFHVSTLYLPDPAYLKKGADNSTYCDLFYDGYLNIVEAAKEKGVRIVYLKKGSVFTIGNARFEVLWGCNYNNGVYDTHYINNNSLVTRVTSGDTIYLTCGDIEKEVENQLVASGINLRADIFKFSHHGGNTSNIASFVRKVNPSFSYFNFNGDTPTAYGQGWVASSVANLQDISNIYSSRYNGMLTFSVKSGHISVAGERNMQAVSVDIKDSAGKVVNNVTYQFNNADKHVITDRMKESAATVSGADATTAIPPRIKNGTWKADSAGWHYYDANGDLVKSKFVTISGKTYYLDSKGVMLTGWQTINGKKYYFESDGSMLYRWKRVDGEKYLFDYLDGHMHTGWVQENGKWYYLDPVKGYLVTGWVTTGGATYYMQDDYTMFDGGWLTIGGKAYYFEASGRMLTGWLRSGSLTYYLGKDGARVSGVQVIDGRSYTFNAQGVLQGDPPDSVPSASTADISGGTKLTGWQTIDGKTYYYDENGTKLLRWKRIDGKKYLLDPEDGHLHTGWTYAEDTRGWYYLDPNEGGAMVYGSQLIDGDYFYLNPDDGKMLASGWAVVDGKKYYYDGNGRRVMNKEITSDGRKYYLTADGSVFTGWRAVSGSWYYYDAEGAMMTSGWVYSDGDWYYMNQNGVMVTGSQTIGGKVYSFTGSGALQGEPPSVTSESTDLWDKGTDSDMAYDVTTPRSQAFVNDMLRYATYFDGKISYGSSQNGTDPNNLRYQRLRSGGVTDCSWFVYHVLHKYGLLKDFVHSYEWGNSPSTYPGGVNIGSDLSKASPGDIICTGTGTKPQNSHVMIYLGGNKAVECAAGHGVQITTIYGSPREIVHFKSLPSNPTGTYVKTAVSTGVTATSGKWEQDSKGWRYNNGSSYITDRFYNVGTKTYYFNSDGYMLTGWQNIGGKTYYFDSSGALLRRWKRIDGKKYLFDYTDGHLHTGWTYADDTGGWYYLNPKDRGAMMYGWQNIGGIWYYLDPSSGKMTTGWRAIGGKWYAFAGSGRMLTGWQKIGGKWYLLASSGEMLTGWQYVDGKWYYMNSSGVMQSNCWITWGGKSYYLTASGAMR